MEDLGVLTCKYVADDAADVVFVHHAENGWDFLCAMDHSQDGPEAFVIVGASHLIKQQPDLAELLDLPVGFSARKTTKGRWLRHDEGL